jgi:hypothetical protein
VFKEILKVIPRIENSDLSRMETTLNQRFTRVAKTFGKGLKSVLMGGGVIAGITFLVDKLLNPLKDVSESIEKALSKGDDLVTFSKQFNTTPGNLARLQAFGRSTGLEPEGVRLILGKFQAAVAQASVSDKPTAVSAFVGKTDTAEAFFEFVQAMQKLDPDQRSLVQQEVFGEKQILKTSEFLGANFKELSNLLQVDTETLSIAANRLGANEDKISVLRAQRELNDIITKGSLIGKPTINSINQSENFQLNRENERLAQVENLKRLSLMQDRVAAMIEDFYLKGGVKGLFLMIEKINSLVDMFSKSSFSQDVNTIKKSRTIRGTGSYGKDR